MDLLISFTFIFMIEDLANDSSSILVYINHDKNKLESLTRSGEYLGYYKRSMLQIFMVTLMAKYQS